MHQGGAHHVAQGAAGGLFESFFWLIDIQNKGAGILNAVLNRKLDVDYVEVFGEHLLVRGK